MREFAADACGATAIEYALIGSLISIVIVTAATAVGSKVSGMFTLVSTSLK
ncbi:MAG TPA: Flp family type IVb pilin [Rhizomicrobium sp.]